MYARVATFEQRDMSRVDELMAKVRELDRAGTVPEAEGMLMLIDRANGRAMGITLFATMEALRDAEPAFERMGDEIPEELRGRRIGVETYEVAMAAHLAEAAAHV